MRSADANGRRRPPLTYVALAMFAVFTLAAWITGLPVLMAGSVVALALMLYD